MALGLALGGLVWMVGNPPMGGPDELSHYVKAVGVGGGDLYGSRVVVRSQAENLEHLGDLLEAQSNGKLKAPSESDRRRSAWMRSQTREFAVPSALSVNIYCGPRGDARLRCLRHLRAVPPVSKQSTPMGTYFPLAYVLPGLVARRAGNAEAAVRWARLPITALCVGLLGLAIAVVARGGRGGTLALLGLVVALTPAVFLSSTTLNPSGPEIAGSIAFASGLLSVTRARGRWWAAWLAVAAGGVALAGSRSFGPLFVAAALVFVGLLAGRPGLRAAVARPRTPAIVAAGVFAIAAVLNAVWEATEQPHLRAGRADVRPGISDAWRTLPDLGEQAVGVFGGALDVDMPSLLYVIWGILLVGLVGAALKLGDQPERLLLAGTTATILASVFVLSIAVRPTGFGLQGRHLLPLAVLLPIGAGEVLRRHADKVTAATAQRALLGAIGVATLVHVSAWYVNAHAWAADTAGPRFLLSDAAWSPPIAWLILSACLLTAAAAISIAAYSGSPTASRAASGSL